MVSKNSRLSGLVLGFVVAGLTFAGTASAATTWQVQPSPNQGSASTSNQLDAVAATSATNAWAVGEYLTGAHGQTFQTLVERWNGAAWQIQPSPNIGSSDNDLFSVAATSPTNAWAVGYYFNGSDYQTLIEHWNGTAWQVQPSPNPSPVYDQLSAVVAFSATNAWAIGEAFNSGLVARTLVEHWNGTAWQVETGANRGAAANDLYGLGASSATNAWAAGEFFDGSAYHTLIEHWNGTAWQAQPSPDPGGLTNDNFLAGVAATSATNAWAAGYYDDGGEFATLVEHWNGTAWQVQPTSNPSSSDNELTAVAATSATNAWTVGSYYDGNANQTLIEGWNGTAWQVQPSPNPGGSLSGNYLNGVAPASATSAWAVGWYYNGTSDRTLIERSSG